jgi:chromosome segregation ATPase
MKKQLEDMEEVRRQAERATALAGEVAILRAEQLVLRGEVKDANAQRDRERARVEASEAQVRRAQAAEGEALAEVRRLKGFLERGAENVRVFAECMRVCADGMVILAPGAEE